MASVQQISGDCIFGISGGSNFTTIGGAGVLDGYISDAACGFPQRTLGTYSNLYVNVSTSTSSGIYTVRLRVATANGNLALSVPNNSTGEFQDIVNTDSPTAGQIVCASGTSGVIPPTFRTLGVTFAASSGTTGRFGSGIGINFSTASTTLFVPITGNSIAKATESDVQVQLVNAVTFENIAVNCSAKARSKADTVTIRKNAVNGTSSISVTGTGVFEDITGPFDTYAANDNVNFAVTTGSGTGTDTFSFFTAEQSSTDSTFHLLNCDDGSRTIAFGQTAYLCISGSMTNTSVQGGTETGVQTNMFVAGSMSNLGANIITNSVNATTTFTLRQGAADTALTTSIGASTTGFIQDTTHSVTIAVGDNLNWKIVTGGSSGTIDTAAMAALFTVGATASLTAGEMVASAMFGFIQPFPLRTQIIDY